MRHVIGFLLALVVAVAVFFGASWGYLRLLRIPVANGAASTLPAGGGSLLHDRNALLAFAALAAIALLAGICAVLPRISPLAAGLPGLVLIAWTIFYAVSVRRAVRYIPLKSDAFGTGFEAMLINGVLAVVGFALVIPLFIPSRWREPVPAAEILQGTVVPPPRSPLISSTSPWAETAPIEQPPFPPLDPPPYNQPPGDPWR
jgi:hypothetical protein